MYEKSNSKEANPDALCDKIVAPILPEGHEEEKETTRKEERKMGIVATLGRWAEPRSKKHAHSLWRGSKWSRKGGGAEEGANSQTREGKKAKATDRVNGIRAET